VWELTALPRPPTLLLREGRKRGGRGRKGKGEKGRGRYDLTYDLGNDLAVWRG